MAPQFEEAIDGLEEGDVSELFEFDNAFHILKITREIPPGRVPLEDVEAQIREQLYSDLLEERFKRWAQEDLRKRYHVTLHYDQVAGLL